VIAGERNHLAAVLRRGVCRSGEAPQSIQGSRALVDHAAGYIQNRIPRRPNVTGSDKAAVRGIRIIDQSLRVYRGESKSWRVGCAR
jgi:hypothetical protein